MNKIIILILFNLGMVAFANSQSIKFNGYYECKGDQSYSYIRFYADGIVLQVTFSNGVSKEYLLDFLNYENKNKRNVSKGFFINESSNIEIGLLQQWDNELFLQKATIKMDGSLIIKSYHYDQGIVKSNTSTYNFTEF